VAEHPGGLQAIMAVWMQLVLLGYDVHIVVPCGSSAEVVLSNSDSANIPWQAWDTAEEVLREHKDAVVLVASMCASGGFLEALVQGFRHGPRIFIQEIGQGGLDLPAPDVFCIGDPDSIERIRKISEFSQVRFEVTGFPSLDEVAGWRLTPKEIREARYKLGMEDDSRPSVLFVGDVEASTVDDLREVVLSTKASGKDTYLIARPHPRMKDDACAGWDGVLEDLKTGSIEAIDASDFEGKIVAVVDVVIGRGSTMMVHAAILGKQVISVLYPEQARILFDITGIPHFFLALCGCATEADDKSKLDAYVASALKDSPKLTSHQNVHWEKTGEAALEVARVVDRCIKMIV